MNGTVCLMNCCRVVVNIVCLMIYGVSTSVAGNEPNHLRAVAAIFGDEHVQQKALQIHLKAAAMPLERQFAFLSRWVLPSDEHNSLRMQIDFTQSYPAPGNVRKALPPGRMIASGADLIAPAVDLVNVASQLNRLEQIRSVAESWQPAVGEDQKSRAAFMSIIAIAQKDFAAAETHVRQLLELATSLPVTQRERGPEAIVVWFARQHNATREAARDLAVRLFDDVQVDKGRPTERWKRHIFAMKYAIDAEARDATTGLPAKDAGALDNWIPVSRMTSESRGTGSPRSVWMTATGKAAHVSGHDHDYLYYASPLTGDFSVEADLTTFGNQDLHLGFGTIWAGSRWDLKRSITADFRYDGPSSPFDPPLTRMFDWMRVRMDIRNNVRTQYINGRKVFEKPHPSGSDPWLALHSWWMANGTVKNLRIIGDPVIPEQIELAAQFELPGWLPYFDETVGGPQNDWYLRPASKPEKNAIQESNREFIGRLRPELSGTDSESLVRYHRPIVEDGTIEYEFYYEPQRILVHPTLDRLCCLLNPEGVAIHWITDGRFDPNGTDPGNQIQDPTNRRNIRQLPLIANQWNRISLTIHGDTVDIELNGMLVCSRLLETGNLRTFGLFHYADQTEARVRNLRWRGKWSRDLPQSSEQKLADNHLERLLGDVASLPIVLQHDFRQGLPREKFSIAGGGWEDNIRQEPDGLRVSRPGGHYVNYTITTPLIMSGDFDVTAAIRQFESTVAEGGEGNVQMTVVFADERSTECNLSRKHYLFAEQREEQIIQPSVFEKRKGETAYAFFNASAEESTAGRMRFARRGTVLYFLFAEDDSPEFRLIHQEEVGTADATLKLVAGHHLAGTTSVVWDSLTARSQTASGLPEASWATLQQLDAQRSKLPATVRFDLTGKVPTAGTLGLEQFQIWGGDKAEFSRDRDGLKIDVPGAEQWQAAGVVPRVSFEGDFDVSLNLEVLHLEPSKVADESTVLLQAEFDDALKSVSEIKYSIDSDGHRAVETQRRRARLDGTLDHQELQTAKASSAKLLRLARRGDLIYQIFQESPDTDPIVLGAMMIGTDPVPEGFLRALIHTGGANRRTVVLFKSLEIQADRIIK